MSTSYTSDRSASPSRSRPRRERSVNFGDFQENNTGSGYQRGGRPSYGGGNSGGRPSYGGGRGGGFGGGRGRRFAPLSSRGLDLNRYIKIAEKLTPTTEYQSKHTFADFEIDDRIKDIITERGYTTPTAIQDQAIPEILAGHDVIGVANTGTGKTAAFLLPLIHQTLQAKVDKKVLQTLIIVPTRELAMQIEDELRKFTTQDMWIFSVCCYGGNAIFKQIQRLRKPQHFVIGTPGRLKDLIDRGFIQLDMYHRVVLDEVDRMLDMGFVDDITWIIDQLPKERQSLFFSATIDRKQEPLIDKLMKNPVTISVRTQVTSDHVNQDVVRPQNGMSKIDTLHELLKKDEVTKTIIFSQTKMGAERILLSLEDKGHRIEALHGDMQQSRRQVAIKKFKNGDVDVLVATDVAARGLDIDDVSHVINYEIPPNYDDYVHRIGRTGRGGKTGQAYTFVD
jgi:ATP-dependent RNA helicase RhlE